MSESPIGRTGPVGEVRHVPAGPRNVPHTVTNVVVDAEAEVVRFEGPAWSGQSDQYSADIRGHQGDVNAAIRAAIEERMYGPGAPCSVEPDAPSAAPPA